MISHGYSQHGLGSSARTSLASLGGLGGLPPLPPYTSPYSGQTRYHDVAPRYDHISPYSTPNNYSRLSRGYSLQDVGSPLSPKAGRRLPRQSSLELEVRRGVTSRPGPHETLLQQDWRRRQRRPGSESGRGEHHEKKRKVDCNKICTGIIIGNGETVLDLNYLKDAGVTHVLNTAEQHVSVNQASYASRGIQYYGFHVDDLPHCNISRYFHRTTEFIDRAITGGGLVVVNCYMGLSRSSSVVIAYLITKHNMSFDRALDFVRKSRTVRPNEGFVRQLRDLELNLKRRR